MAKATADTVGSDSDILTSIENLVGSNQGDMLTGNAGNNVLHGGEGDDKLYGGAGDDSLYGDRSNDTMYGDAGNDTFYSDVVAGQADTIVVAEVGDHLRLLNLSPDVSVTVAGTTVGTAFDASNNVRFVDHQLQVDVDGNKAFRCHERLRRQSQRRRLGDLGCYDPGIRVWCTADSRRHPTRCSP